MNSFICRSSAETYHLGFSYGRRALPGAVLLFNGDLGAGKTTFIKGFVAGFLPSSEHSGIEVTSPTFTYLNIYEGISRLHLPAAIYHFDLYRLRDLDEFLSMGFDEFFDAGAFCCVEWAEKLSGLHIPHAVQIAIRHLEEGARAITFDKGH